SWELVRGRFFWLIGLFLVVGIADTVVYLVVRTIVGAVFPDAGLGGFAGGVLSGAITSAAGIILFGIASGVAYASAVPEAVSTSTASEIASAADARMDAVEAGAHEV